MDFYEGSDAKLLIDLKAIGFNQADDNYIIEVHNNDDVLTFNQNDIRDDAEGNHFLPITRDKLHAGSLVVVITVLIPDSHFPDGIRREKAKPIVLPPVKKAIV